jgi:RHS repeat-associated protein
LTLASGPAAQSTSIGYDAIGNLTSKTGVGTYTYHATRKHAVVSAGGSSYTYDGNGNLISRGGATVTWSSYNLPTYLADPNGYSAQFWYAPDRSRWKQVSSYAGGTETTLYVGGLLEKLTTATRTHWKHLIATPSGQVQVIRRSDGTTDTFYVTTDHLGSTDAVLNAAGAVLMRGSFGVHGARRASNWQGAPTTTEWQAIANTTREGYTGHEMLDNVLLVHMNGRVFDPNIGRFLSADPYIDGPGTTQGWNRYAYVKGRVLAATDPTGFTDEERPDVRPTMPNEPWVTQENGVDTVTVTASRLSPIYIHGGGGGIAGNTGERGGGGQPRQPPKKEPAPEQVCSQINAAQASQIRDDAVTGGAAGGLSAATVGAVGGGWYGLGSALHEARHLGMVFRVMAISEGAGAGAIAGGTTLGPVGAIGGALLFVSIDFAIILATSSDGC